MSDFKEITNMQMIVFFISTIIGGGVVTLPRTTAEIVGSPNMWVSLFVGGGLAFLNALLILALMKRHPKLTLFELSPRLVGEWFGKGLSIIFILYTIALSASVIRIMSTIVKQYLLDQTPAFVVMIVFLLTCMYLVIGTLFNVIQYLHLYFPIMLLMFILFAMLSINSIETTNLRPFFQSDFVSVLKGSETTYFSFVGYELLMILSGYRTKLQWKPISKVLGLSIGIVTLIYFIFFVLTIGILSVAEIKNITFPTIEMAKSIEFQGFFFERFEILFLIGWIITTFTTVAAYYFASVLGFCRTFHIKKGKYATYGLGIIILVVATIPPGVIELFEYMEYMNYLSYVAIIGIPALLLCVSLFKGDLQ